MVNIVLFGPPGAGKGTQSEKIIQKYGLKHISTGDLFRKHLGEGTELGKKAQGFMDNGKLVPDEVVIGMVEDTINEFKASPGFILDGFPRTVAQAVALDAVLDNHNTGIACMVMLDVPQVELKKRLLERGKTSGRADDQNEEKINVRIQEYLNKTVPVAEFYTAQKKICKVNGVGSIDSIFEQIAAAIDNHYA
jgi:adenylate kinase